LEAALEAELATEPTELAAAETALLTFEDADADAVMPDMVESAP
jgi:hypothetical protein